MRYVLTCLICYCLQPGFAQQDFVTTMKVEPVEDRIVIEYDLKKLNLPNYYYTVDLQVSEEGKLIFPSADLLRGDVSGSEKKKIVPGDNLKKIYWEPLREPNLQELRGEVSFRLIVHLYAPVFGGPESALSSILVPGLGQYKVQKKKGPYFLITAAAYGLVGTGIAKKIQSNNTYSDYLAASTPNDIASLKDAYQSQKRIGTALLAGGAVVWLADVAWVLLQGMRNKNAYQDIRKS
ncbi:MAG: hypothetical protein IT260_04265, partial [Saprospiraceae bacterium]|nr:hypothetical protein [Saprospiraceae bacterium]